MELKPLPTATFPDIEQVRFEAARFSYDKHRAVFDGLTLELPMNTNVFITGAGGAGQSTLLKLMAVLLQPQAGRYLINNIDTTDMSFEDFLRIRLKIGYTFDFGGLFTNRSLTDNLTMPLLYHKMCSQEEADERVLALATDFGFERQLHQRPAMVSGGLRKLTCVLRAFIMRPQMMVMDDPFTGVGMDASRKLVRMIQERRDSGELKHVYMTSRDEVWPHWIGCDSLFIDHGHIRFEERKAG